MNMHLEIMPETAVIYLRRTGPYGGDNRDLMERLKAWAAGNGLLENGTILGIAWDDPAQTPPERCRYDVCLISQGNLREPGAGMSPGRLPGGRYAFFQGPHTPEGVQSLWQTAFTALPELGFTPDPGRPVMERYRPELLAQGVCELCIPV